MYATFIAVPDRELLPTIQQVKRLDDGRFAFPLSNGTSCGVKFLTTIRSRHS